MRLMRTLWSYLMRVVRALRDLFAGISGFFRGLIGGLVEKPVDAFERLSGHLVQALGRLLQFILTLWSRIWQRAPSTPRDRRRTPGRAGLPLLAGLSTVVIWYLFPFADWLDLGSWGFLGCLALTWMLAFSGCRSCCRRQPIGRIGNWMVDVSRRTGLMWLERLGFLGLFVGAIVLRNDADAAFAPTILAIGFLALLASPYRERALTDALPEMRPSPDGSDDGTFVERSDGDVVMREFRWSLPDVDGVDEIEICVVVDLDRLGAMRSANPKVPMSDRVPDWTPWVVDGATPEVWRAAAEIRKRMHDLGLSRFEEAMATLGFAQSIEYSLDVDTTGAEEYWRYPIETIYDQTGDCEDSAILAAAVLRTLGHGVIPIVTREHAALAVEAPVGMPGTFVEFEGRHYYYCETTTEGFRIGALPADVKIQELRICPLREPEPAGIGPTAGS